MRLTSYRLRTTRIHHDDRHARPAVGSEARHGPHPPPVPSLLVEHLLPVGLDRPEVVRVPPHDTAPLGLPAQVLERVVVYRGLRRAHQVNVPEPHQAHGAEYGKGEHRREQRRRLLIRVERSRLDADRVHAPQLRDLSRVPPVRVYSTNDGVYSTHGTVEWHAFQPRGQAVPSVPRGSPRERHREETREPEPGEKVEEVPVVPVSHAVVDPRAMVVHLEHALAAHLAVVRELGLGALAAVAPASHPGASLSAQHLHVLLPGRARVGFGGHEVVEHRVEEHPRGERGQRRPRHTVLRLG